jgi:hypothetical protein
LATLSKAEKLLIAAGHLSADGRRQFSAEDLAVAAFKEFPDDFSLKGYSQFPDVNMVLTQLMGKKAPLLVRGWLEKTGTKQYQLTSKGLHDLSQLGDSAATVATVRLDREMEDGLGRLLTSTAYSLFKRDQSDRITFHQFCRFVGLSAADKWQRIAGKLSYLEYLVSEAMKLGEAGDGINVHHQKRNHIFTPDDLRTLGALHSFLKERFRHEMEEWKRNATA